MDDDLDLPGGLAHLDDPLPPAFGDDGAGAARAASRRRRAQAVGGVGTGGLVAALLAIALLVPQGNGSRTELADAAPSIAPTSTTPGPVIGDATSTTAVSSPGPEAFHPVPSTVAPPPVVTTVQPTQTTTTTRPQTDPTATTTTPDKASPPRGQQAPRSGVVFSVEVRSRTMRWDERQDVVARLYNGSKEDLRILAGCGVTYADLYDMQGEVANDHSRSTARCDEQTGYFAPAVVRPGESREAIVPLVARGPGNPEAREGYPGVPPGRYQAYASWALDSGQAGSIEYLHSGRELIQVVGR